MNDSFGGDFNATQTQNSGAASDNKPEGNAPVMIKQIIESPEGNFQMWDIKFGMVICTALVRTIETSSTKITYLLEDHTGRIESHYWLEEGDTQKTPDVMINNYVKVYGSVRSQAGDKILMIFKMFPINDPNEVCTHMLEALHARYKCEEFATKGPGGGAWNGGAAKGNSTSGVGAGLETKQLAVFQAVRQYIGDGGISRDDLHNRFKHIRQGELNAIIDFLTAEGHIYSSYDADHFLATE